jgi:hypothetical protein
VAAGGATLLLCGAYFMDDEEESELQLYEMVSVGDTAGGGGVDNEDTDLDDLDELTDDDDDNVIEVGAADAGGREGQTDAEGRSILPQRRSS